MGVDRISSGGGERPRRRATTPAVTVVVPTYERGDQLRRCLHALAALRYPRGRLEVIVVDDGSPTSPAPLVTRAASRGLPVRLLAQENRGPAAARNAGARAASGTMLAFTDDDCAPEPDWLAALTGRLAGAPGTMVYGHTENALPENPYSTASQLLVDYLSAYYNVDPRNAAFLTSNNIACDADAFAQLGGFDERFAGSAGEDRDFADRWVRSGRRIVVEPRAVVLHRNASSLREFLRQHDGYGSGAFQLHRRRAERGTGAARLAPLPFYAGLLTAPQHARIASPAAVTALLGLSQAAHVSGYVRAALRVRAPGSEL